MTTKYDAARSKVQYSKKEFPQYELNLKAALRLHSNKLDTVMTDGKLNALLQQNYEDKLIQTVNKNGDRIYDDAAVATRALTLLEECKAEVAAEILLTLPDGLYKDRLDRDHGRDGNAMYKAMRKYHTHESNETRIETVADDMATHLTDGLVALTCDKFSAWCDKLEDYNLKLKGTEEALSEAQYCKKMVKAITDKDPVWGKTLKTAHKTEIDAKDPVSLRSALEATLEAADKADEDKAARDARTALAARTDQSHRVAELEAQVAALRANVRGNAGTGGAGRRGELATCTTCGVKHPGDQGDKCIGLLVSTGKLSEAEAKKTLPTTFDDDRKTRTVKASVRSYESHQAQQGNGGGTSVKKLAARARVETGDADWLTSGDDMSDEEVDAKYAKMYGTPAARTPDQASAARIAELERQLAEKASVAVKAAPRGVVHVRIPWRLTILAVVMLLASFALSSGVSSGTAQSQTAAVQAAGRAGGIYPTFLPLVMGATTPTPTPTPTGSGPSPTPGPASRDEADTDGGGTPWYLRPLRGSGYAFYTFVSSVVILCGILVHSTWQQALVALANLCNSLGYFEAVFFNTLRAGIVAALTLGAPPTMVSSVSNVRIVDARPARLGGAAAANITTVSASAVRATLPPGTSTKTRNDTGCEQTMFPDIAFFPDGFKRPTVRTLVRVADNHCVEATGVGTARVGKWENGTMHEISFRDALLVPQLGEALISEEHCRKSKVEMRFYTHRDMIFHDHDDFRVTFNEDNTMDVQILHPKCPAALAAGEPYGRTITKGRPSAREGRMSEAALGALWGARLNICAERLRALPEVATGVPQKLAAVQRPDVTSDAIVRANAPRNHAPQVARPATTRPGELSVMDLWCVGRDRTTTCHDALYTLTITDVHTGEIYPYLIENKGEVDPCVKRHIVRLQGTTIADGQRYDFTGGVLYTDNEHAVKNSKVRETCAQAGLTLKTSCPYEPWQNGIAERVHRSAGEQLRIMCTRGGGKPTHKYWGWAFLQFALIHNRTPHSWCPKSSPTALRTGEKQSLAMIKPMFCSASVTIPRGRRAMAGDTKLDAQAYMCMHLGCSRTQPGWVFEILEGPRAGEIYTAGPASVNAFYEEHFPLVEGDSSPSTAFDLDVDLIREQPPLESAMHLTGTRPLDITNDDAVPRPQAQAQPQPAGTHLWQGPAAHTPGGHLAGGVDVGGRRHSARLDGGSLGNPVDYVPQRLACFTSCFSTGSMCGELVVGTVERIVSALGVRAPGSYKRIADIEDAEERKGWYESYAKEFDPLIEKGILKPVPRPQGVKVLPLHELMYYKNSGRKKTRGAVGGNHAERGTDGENSYAESTSPTALWKSTRTAVAVAAHNDMDATTVDISQAYINASLAPGQKFYCELPRGYRHLYKDENGEPMVAECGNLYGIPPAGRNWFLHVTSTDPKTGLRGWGLEQSQDDPCVLTKVNDKGERIIIVLYVDDFLIFTTKGSTLKAEFLAWLGEAYDYTGGEDISVTGHLDWLGAEITKVDGGFKIASPRYIKDTLARYAAGGHHAHYNVPCTQDLKKHVQTASESKSATVNKTTFRSLLGEMQYLASSDRPDVCYAIGMLSRCQEWPDEACMRDLEQVAIYLYKTADLGITYGRITEDTALSWLFGMSDADWSLSHSTSGWSFSFSNAVVSYGSKKQHSIALSTCEAEIMASSLAACEAVFLRNLFEFLGLSMAAATLLYMDNTGAERVAKHHVLHNVAKHMARRELKIRELVAAGIVEPKHVSSKGNLADLFTKPLERRTFQTLRNSLMNITA